MVHAAAVERKIYQETDASSVAGEGDGTLHCQAYTPSTVHGVLSER
jgi:hypothetical protein